MRYIISGGGTGGHIFPAIAIGNAIQRLDSEAEILFVGAENRMEMERVPAAGFNIVGLPVAGFNRKNVFKNIPVLFKLYRSLRKAKQIIHDFKPDVAIGVGGYASGPILKEAQRHNIPTLLQEQNSYAGVTNRMLAKNADKICVAYDGMETFFPSDKIVKTGNPLRRDIVQATSIDRQTAKKQLGFNPAAPLVAVIGGSLGAQTINNATKAAIKTILDNGASLLWQTGKRYFEEYKAMADDYKSEQLQIKPFIENMNMVYAGADIIVSRAGACTISEIQYLGVPSILIPSPNVAEDHQRKNAEALANRTAALMILDKDAEAELPIIIADFLSDKNKQAMIAANARLMGTEEADKKIASFAIELAKKTKHS